MNTCKSEKDEVNDDTDEHGEVTLTFIILRSFEEGGGEDDDDRRDDAKMHATGDWLLLLTGKLLQ